MIQTATEPTKDLENFKEALDLTSIVAITNKNGNITYVNDKFCEISKYSREELVGMNHRILKSGYHDDRFFEDMWKTISSGKVWDGEIKNKAKDGTFYWVKTTIVPFFDTSGNIIKYLAIRTDITKQKKIHEKIVKMEKLTAIGELASRISHDLKNPLSVMKISIENYKYRHEKNFDDMDKKTFQRLDNAILRISHQINDILSFVKSNPLQFKVVEISSIIKNAVNSMEIPDGIIVNLPSNQCTISCDASRLEPVFNNLIINSIQSMDNKGEINIRLFDEDKNVILEFEDSGARIPDNVFSKMFEPLYTTKQTGTGLGLVTCKKIIEAHGGTISAKNIPTIFTITLPKILD
ncbi:MAG: PAS domain-containing protein [Thaumarchaeota archaeon]|nr:PAS domain-containing protein [Nitrososphaerota archaeon]